jgi:CBS domain-containing protein
LALLDAGCAGLVVTAYGSRLSDAVLARCVDLAHGEHGPAPASYALCAVGSQGRGEQTLSTDQDNILIHAGDDDGDGGWFRAFAATVNALYAEAGFRLCPGEAMARRWCGSVAWWRRTFATWIERGEDQGLIDIGIMADFRVIVGSDAVAEEVRSAIHQAAAGRSVFFLKLAEHILSYRPPLSLLGHLRPAGPDHDHIDLKQPLVHLVEVLRIYALAHGVTAVASAARIDALVAAGVLSTDAGRDLRQAMDVLLTLRLRHQRAALDDPFAGASVPLAELSSWDRHLLERIVAHLTTLQARIRLDFMRQG